jgi:hypothetical protein
MSNVTPEQRRIYNETWKKRHPIKYRKTNKLSSRKHRAKNLEHIRSYQKEYFNEWLNNPVNYRCHTARTKVSSIKHTLKKNNGIFKKQPSKETLIILNNLKDIGWSYDLPSTVVVNHKISLKLLFTFNIDIPLNVVFDVRNLELIPRELNNCVSKRRVNAEVIQTAQVLENKYPEWLTGFTSFLKERRGEVN